MTYRELILKLCGPTDLIHGCPILISDTAFFDENGKVTEIVKTDKEGFISSIGGDPKQKKSLLDTIRRTFSFIVRERRKEISLEQLQ